MGQSVSPLASQQAIKKKSKWEIYLSMRASSQKADLNELPVVGYGLNPFWAVSYYQATLKNFNFTSGSLDLARTNTIMNALLAGSFSVNGYPPEQMRQITYSFLAETIVQEVAAMQNVSDAEIQFQVDRFILANTHSEEDRFLLLAILSDRLYLDYNSLLDPLQNKAKNRPAGVQVNDRDMNLIQAFTGAAQMNPDQGIVCNGVVEVLLKIAAPLFPNDDVLGITGGSHFGLLVAGKDGTYRIIDGGDQYTEKNQITLLPDVQIQEVRIFKMVNGAMAQIGTGRTQMGRLIDESLQLDVPSVQLSADIQSFLTHASREWTKNGRKHVRVLATQGEASFSGNHVMVAAEKVQVDFPKWGYYLGGATTIQTHANENSIYQFYLDAGAEHSIIKRELDFSNAKLKIKATTGVRVTGVGSFGSNDATHAANNGGLDLIQRVNADLEKSGFEVRNDFAMDHSLGPKNLGDMEGALSDLGLNNLGRALGDTYFVLAAIQDHGQLWISLPHRTTKLKMDMNYLGSNLGQKMGMTGGAESQVLSSKFSFYYFAGYLLDGKGYRLEHANLIAGQPAGFEFGAQLSRNANQNRTNFNVEVKGVGGPQPLVNLRANIYLFPIRKKSKP